MAFIELLEQQQQHSHNYRQGLLRQRQQLDTEQHLGDCWRYL
jgi:hypothetical protein